DPLRPAIENRLAKWSAMLLTHGHVDEIRVHAMALDIHTAGTSFHTVAALHDCATCKQVTKCAPSLRNHCSRLTGIVTHVELTEQPVAGAYRARARWRAPRPVPGLGIHVRPFPSYGRGETPEEAVDGCIGEALERYSLIYRGDEPVVRTGFDTAVA